MREIDIKSKKQVNPPFLTRRTFFQQISVLKELHGRQYSNKKKRLMGTNDDININRNEHAVHDKIRANILSVYDRFFFIC